MNKEPLRNEVYWNYLGRMLKLWRRAKISDTHAQKLLKLWIGYEFTDLMDDYGRYPSYYFNEIRRRLGFPYFSTFLDSLRRTQSFFIVGRDDGTVTAIFSPLWHEWEEADGMRLTGSMPASGKSQDLSQDLSQDFDVNRQINTNKDTTVGNDGALSPDGAQDDTPREVHVRRRIVRDYFLGLQKQTDTESISLIEDIRYRIMNPRDKCGQIIESLKLTEEQTDEAFQILVDKVLVKYFSSRDDFFKPTYMAHPENRIWWMTAFFKKYGGPFITDARKKWRYGRRSRESEQAHEENQLQQQYRPLSPHEWQTPDGQRWYMTQKGQKQQIPETAEPRPTETSTFNYIKNQWQETRN